MLLAAFILAYLLGSIPFGIIIGKKVKGIDIREHGSRNTGATNVFRVVGKSWGLLALFLDILKGYLAVLLPKLVFEDAISLNWLLLIGVAAIAGHSYPVWLSFKGGKGVATSLGVFLGLAFFPTLFTFLFWCAVFAMTRIISLSSLSAALFFPAAAYFWAQNEPGGRSLWVVSCFLAAFIFYTHRSNIRRLLRGEENKII